MRLFLILAIIMIIPELALADPLDAGEGYVSRGAPDMLGYAGLAILMLNYVLFGLQQEDDGLPLKRMISLQYKEDDLFSVVVRWM